MTLPALALCTCGEKPEAASFKTISSGTAHFFRCLPCGIDGAPKWRKEDAAKAWTEAVGNDVEGRGTT